MSYEYAVYKAGKVILLKIEKFLNWYYYNICWLK